MTNTKRSIDGETREQDTDDQEAAELKVPCLCFSRIVGYLTPVQSWNKGKSQEFEERVLFDVEKMLQSEYNNRKPL